MKGGGGGGKGFWLEENFCHAYSCDVFFPQFWDTHNFLTPPKDLFPLCSLNSRSI